MAEAEPRESLRRQATVLFADISGFTAMSEKLDAEQVTEIMNACFARVERVIREHGGTIDKFIGDAVMALFGATSALENAPRRAVAAALAIRAALVRFNQQHDLPVPLEVHIGVNSGLVIAGDVGGEHKRDFTVMGDPVNLAARLEDASSNGQIFVGPATYAATREHFDYRRLKPLTLKGKAMPVAAYEVLAAKSGAQLARLVARSRQIRSELVGRDDELRTLRERISRLARDGAGGIVSLVGDAGIGKSRLLAELGDLPELRDVLVLRGHCDAVGAGLSFHPFVDLLRGWAGLLDTDDDGAALGKLAGALATSLPGRVDDVLPFVATLLGLRVEGEPGARIAALESDALEKLVTKALNDIVTALAARRPLVLLFEDLHWADLSSIKLLEALLRLSAEHRVLYLFAYRPHFNATSSRIAEVSRGRHAARNVEIALEPLDERQAGVMVRNLLGIDDLPHAARLAIQRKAEGNPLFIEEVVRALLDQGTIDVRARRLETTEAFESLAIPGTLQEVILSRVDQTDDRTRRVLQIGAVIGRAFQHSLLASLVDDASTLDETMQRLHERQLVLSRDPATSSAGEREYAFQHALIQETVYESLLTRTRTALHRRVAETIERLYAERLEDLYGMLALHYGRCGDPERAEDYLLKAGEVAARAAASSEALGYFREAYRLYRLRNGDGGDPRQLFRLEKNLATALLYTGDLTASRPHFDRALEYLGEKVARTPAAAWLQLVRDLARVLARVYVLRGRMSRRPSTPELREALSLLYNRARVESVADPDWFLFDSMYMTGRLATVDPRTVEQSFAQWAGVALLFSYSGLSFAVSRRVAEVARSVMREDRPEDLFTYHLMNFMRDYFEGAWDRPSGVDDAFVERMLRRGQFWDVDTFLGMEAYKCIDVGDLAGARARLAKIGEIVDEYGYEFADTNRLGIATFIAVAERRLDDAAAFVALYLERPERMLNLIGLGNKAKIELLQGLPEEARRTLDEAALLERRIGRATPFHSGWVRTSRLLLDVVDLGAARSRDPRALAPLRKRFVADARRGVRTARALAMIRTETYRHVGTGHWLLGDRARAIAWWERSVAEGTRLGALPEMARTHLEIGRRLRADARPHTQVAGANADEHVAIGLSLMAQLELCEEHPPPPLAMVSTTPRRRRELA
jgi:class 3 adenylate cyclase